MVTECAGCGQTAPEARDEAGYRRVTPPGWFWLTSLGGGDKWHFCSLACVASWSARCTAQLRSLAG